MHRATWNGVVIAESDDVVTVEGNLYFPRSAVKDELLSPSKTVTVCGWKGDCNYYDLTVDGKVNRDAVWYYAHPKDAAKQILNRVAFWKGIKTE